MVAEIGRRRPRRPQAYHVFLENNAFIENASESARKITPHPPPPRKARGILENPESRRAFWLPPWGAFPPPGRARPLRRAANARVSAAFCAQIPRIQQARPRFLVFDPVAIRTSRRYTEIPAILLRPAQRPFTGLSRLTRFRHIVSNNA